MELLCGVPRPPRRPTWGSAWGRASTGKGGGTTKVDSTWGSIKRSATLPAWGTASGRHNRSNPQASGRHNKSSPQAYRRHLLPPSPPPNRGDSQATKDPYSEPLCLPITLAGQDDDPTVPSPLRRAHTLPHHYLRRPTTTLPSPATTRRDEGSLKRGEGSIRRSEGSIRRGEGSIGRPSPSPALSTHPEDTESLSVHDASSCTGTLTDTDISEEPTPAASLVGSFRRTLTLPPTAICRRCPGGLRNSDRRKPTFVHSKTDPSDSDKEATEVGGKAWRGGKRHSVSSTASGLSRLTSTTATDEGVCISSEGGSVTSASMCGTSSVDEGISLYSAPSLASSADLSSVASLYERTGARPKLRPNQGGIFQVREGGEDPLDEEKCLRCQREAAGGPCTGTFRRTRSLRNPRHLPVTPTLLRLLQLGLEQVGGNVGVSGVQRREKPHPPRIDAHRFSRANLEDSGDVELDTILGELCALETQFEFEISTKTNTSPAPPPQTLSSPSARTQAPSTTIITDKMQPKQQQQQQSQQPQLCPDQQQRQNHSRSNSGNTRLKLEPLNVEIDVTTTNMGRTDSPDNDSAFSDNVSMLSSESSASSGASGSGGNRHNANKQLSQVEQAAKLKAEKIKMALEKIKEANVKKLFIKAFTCDGSTKSLLVDEKMTVVHVTRLLADKNHVRMDPKWAMVEHIPDLYMERIYEDDEMLVENLLLWTRDSKNKLLFLERPDKYDLFLRPEQYILIGSLSQKNTDLDDEGRNTLIEEFFSSTGVGVPEVEGPLFLKSEGKKVWKKYYFVLRASGLYYCPKGKSSRSSKDLVCLTTLEVNQVYYGVGWKKKYKAPTDWCFAVKHPHLQAKSSKYIKYLCSEDPRTLAQWVTGIRIAKSGKRLLDNYRALVEDLAQEDIDMLASSRSFSIASMAGQSVGGGESHGTSQATTPSSESRSLDSCLAPSLTPSMADGEEGDDNQSSTGSSQDTPVNTLGRTPVWRQDSLKSGSSSSSSGCLSERSSAGTPTGEHGFESEFPQGTIKRKPSNNPKLPLTSTTRLLVKEIEGEDAVDPARGSAIRQSVRRSLSEEVNTLRRRNSQPRTNVNTSTSSNGGSGVSSPVPQEEEMDSLPLPPPPLELSECEMESLPPPPPELLASTLSLNSLPPPPDEDSLPPINPEDLMMASITSLPPPPPPSPPKPSSPPKVGVPPPPPPHASLPSHPGAPHPPPHGLPLPPPTTPKPVKQMGAGSPVYAGTSIYQSTGSPIYQSTGSPIYQSVTPPAVAPKPRRDSSESPVYSSPPFLAELRAHNAPHPNSPPQPPPHTNNLNGGWHPDSPLPPPPPTPPPHQPPPQPQSILQQPHHSIPPHPSSHQPQSHQPLPPHQGVYAQPQKSPQKKVKRITFMDDVQNIPPTPESPTSKPPLPRRSESTRLTPSNPGRLDCPGNKVTPPRSFLNNLQRVMQKKWQVAQKCKDFDKMPHEVLGFRDPILPSEAERNVGAWIQEHYGSLYENLSPHGHPPVSEAGEREQPVNSHTLQPSPPPHGEDLHRLSQTMPGRKKLPPPPPKRSDSTHLSTRQ